MGKANAQTAEAGDQVALLEELKSLAVKLGYEVRHEKLMREVGYHVRSGSCRVGETKLIFLDRALPTSAQIDVLVDELAGRPLEEIYVSPIARRLLEGGAA